MAQSVAYVLSKNTYPDSSQAELIGVHQGTQIVYASTNTLASDDVLYADSKLTQPIYGNGTSLYGVQLLTDDTVIYAITIDDNGIITTNAPAPPTTLYLSSISSGNACSQTGPIYPITGITFNSGTDLCDSTSLDSNDMINLAGNTTYYVSDGGTNVRTAFKAPGAGITLLTFTSACTSCGATSYTIGQAALGGVIAYINGGGSTGTSGLVATVADISTGASWGCAGTEIIGTGSAIGTGNLNTVDIIAQCIEAGIAAKLCGDLVEGGYSDWYLPSEDELDVLYTNRVAIGGFQNDFYWSSTQTYIPSFQAPNLARGLDFNEGGTHLNLPKTRTSSVRAIRTF